MEIGQNWFGVFQPWLFGTDMVLHHWCICCPVFAFSALCNVYVESSICCCMICAASVCCVQCCWEHGLWQCSVSRCSLRSAVNDLPPVSSSTIHCLALTTYFYFVERLYGLFLFASLWNMLVYFINSLTKKLNTGEKWKLYWNFKPCINICWEESWNSGDFISE